MSLSGAVFLFFLFALNVGYGSMTGKPFLGDVGEMLLLLAAAVLFVVAILKREAAEKEKAADQSP